MTNRNQVRLSKLAFGLAVALAAAPAFAQNTSSAVGGRIVTGDGAPIVGAQVTITHTASGTSSSVTTGDDGRYAARGLRVGGPYTITITKDGKTETRNDVYLPLASTAVVDATIGQPATTTLATVEVTGSAVGSEVFSADKMGTSSLVTRDKIDAFASIKRDLQDYARLDPRVSQTDKERSELSAIGQNARFNSITIDGVSINDTFGLESNGLPTAKQPISIDAIEQIEVNVANYDVTQTRYTGANINAVTKSGTNDFHGSLLYINLDGDNVGDDAGQPFNGFSKEETYGGTLSGPLIKDKLFFFASYEDFQRSNVAPDVRIGNGDGVKSPNEADGVTQSVIDQIAAIASSRYGIADIGNFNLGANTNVKDKLLKIDWNISDNHRASFRYNKTTEAILNFPNLGSSNDDISLSTQWYSQDKSIEGIVGQLYSDWTENFSTEIKFSYRNFDSAPSFAQRLPQVNIDLPGLSGDPDVFFGTERSRQANDLKTDTYNGFFQGDWYLGDHTVRFGIDYERNEIFNLFAQDVFGNWVFNSIADFENNKPNSFQLKRSPTGNINDAAAEFALENYGFFLQDRWSVNANLSLLFGLRVDIPNVDGRPTFNQSVLDKFGVRNDNTIDGQELFQPRFGFNYTFDTERSTQLRGGIGLFQGAAANVWLANPFSNNGLSLVTFGCGTGGLDACSTNTANLPQFTADPDNQPQLQSGRTPAAGVDIIDKGVQQPSNWKFNLAMDKELPNGWVLSGEALFTEVDHAIRYEDLNLGASTTTAQDGRQIFWNAAGLNRNNWNGGNNPISGRGTAATANADRRFTNVIIAKDTGKGSGQSYSIALSNPTSEHWYWQVAYTYTQAEEVSPLTSSVANSNFNARSAFNPNETTVSTANTEIKDRITAAVSYKYFFFKGYKSEVSMFYEGRSGRPYSYVFDNDANGDGRQSNDLLYVPGARGDVLFGSPQEETDFFNFLAANPGLARFAGGVVDRNSARSPWVNNVDLRITQEIPGLFKGNKGTIWLDVLNIGNLIDSDWGHIDQVPFSFNRGIVDFGGIDPATGKYVYRFTSAPDTIDRLANQQGSTQSSRWQLQVGVRYTF